MTRSHLPHFQKKRETIGYKPNAFVLNCRASSICTIIWGVLFNLLLQKTKTKPKPKPKAKAKPKSGKPKSKSKKESEEEESEEEDEESEDVDMSDGSDSDWSHEVPRRA